MLVKVTADDLDSYQAFLEESGNTLGNLEQKILSLEDIEDLALVDDIFRGLHSMKGVASFLQLTSIQKLSHRLESVFDSIRQGKIKPDSQIVNGCLKKVDLLATLVADLADKFEKRKALGDGSFEFDLQEWEEDALEAAEAEASKAARDQVEATELRAAFLKESIELLDAVERRLLELEKHPDQSGGMQEAFRDMHSFKGSCGFFGFAELERLSHRLESFLEIPKSSGTPLKEKACETALKCLDALRQGCSDIGNGGSGRIENYEEMMHELEGLSPQSNVGASAEKTAPSVTSKLPKAAPAAGPTAQAPDIRKDLRVDVGKLDSLLDLVGELVIANGIVTNHPDIQQIEREGFEKASRHLSGIVNEVQKVVLGLRMVPIETVFKKMIRLVHDQSSKSGKKVRLELRGEKTEVDKNIAELIADPLVHMIRNAIDHGIETPEERSAAGKSDCGTVVLEAKQEGSDISIVLSDDGKGLNRERILRKAVENGLCQPNPGPMRDEDIFQFIFAPGFSTAEKLTATSGRGVGMDVVKSNIEKLRGKILIDSKPSLGTTIDLRLPLTLSIIDGMQVSVGEAHFIIPLVAIKETLSPSLDKVTRLDSGQELFMLRGNLFPILRMEKLYGIPDARADLEAGVLLLIESRERKYCLLVDRIVGMRQTVVKSLPPYLGVISGASGCSILVNGEICLILDVEALAESDSVRRGLLRAHRGISHGGEAATRIPNVAEHSMKDDPSWSAARKSVHA